MSTAQWLALLAAQDGRHNVTHCDQDVGAMEKCNVNEYDVDRIEYVYWIRLSCHGFLTGWRCDAFVLVPLSCPLPCCASSLRLKSCWA